MKQFQEFAQATLDLVVIFSIWLVKFFALLVFLSIASYRLGQTCTRFIQEFRLTQSQSKTHPVPLLPPATSPESSLAPDHPLSPDPSRFSLNQLLLSAESESMHNLQYLPDFSLPQIDPFETQSITYNDHVPEILPISNLQTIPDFPLPSHHPNYSMIQTLQPETDSTVSPVSPPPTADSYHSLNLNQLRALCKQRGYKSSRWSKRQCLEHLTNS